MTQTDIASAQPVLHRSAIVNKFSISIASRNGSGSQTANATLLRALFKAGLPVSGKNIFPSNIQGLTTWYVIRADADGFTARQPQADIVVAMSPATAADDLQSVPPGGVFIYPDDFNLALQRTDVSCYPIPAKKLAAEHETNPKLRTYVANMVYVGVLAQLLGLRLENIEAALLTHFHGRRKLVDTNMGVVRAAVEWAAANLTKTDPYRVEEIDATQGMILMDGNAAGALGAVYGGVTFVAWYPITPATTLADALTDYLPRLRLDPETNAPTYAVVQTEDELAAMNMIVGAGWAGARAMTSTSGPGLSLMAEAAGLAYFAEVPVVIWDVQRVGPATGLPTRVAQGDILSAYWLSHGDTRHVCLIPGSVDECFEFGWRAFDLAERLQTPVIVLSDLDLGMNQWISQPFDYPGQPMDRGKVLTAEDVTRLGEFKRYADVDGDGIPWRTLPGTDHPLAAYFTRGSGHSESAMLSEKPEDWRNNMARLDRKCEAARQMAPAPAVDMVPGAEIAIIGYGSTDPAIVEARACLAQRGIKTSYLRVRALPLADAVKDFVAAHRRVYVVEMNADAQMLQLLHLHVPDHPRRLRACNHCDGLPLTAAWIAGAVFKQEGGA